MNKTILSLFGAAMLYACGSTPAQPTTPSESAQEHVAQEPEVQYFTNFPTEQRGDLQIRQCDVAGTLLRYIRRPTIGSYSQTHPEMLESLFDTNGDGVADLFTFRLIHPQAPFASGPFLYIQLQSPRGGGVSILVTSDPNLDCLDGTEESEMQNILQGQQYHLRQHRRLHDGARIQASLNLESHL